jgi:anti-sigma B factor antagonist
LSALPYRLDRGLLGIHVERRGDVQLVTLAGEMDGSNARDLEDEFTRAEAADVSLIVLDLAALEFIDSTGLAVIHRAHRRAELNGHGFDVRRPRGHVKRVLELCGLDEGLSVVD